MVWGCCLMLSLLLSKVMTNSTLAGMMSCTGMLSQVRSELCHQIEIPSPGLAALLAGPPVSRLRQKAEVQSSRVNEGRPVAGQPNNWNCSPSPASRPAAYGQTLISSYLAKPFYKQTVLFAKVIRRMNFLKE